MITAVDQLMTAPTPFTDFPPAIVEMLRDEANLSTAKRVLEEARQECLTRQERVRAQKPSLGFLASKKQREDYNAALNLVVVELGAIDSMLGRVAAARGHVESTLRVALTGHLGQNDDLYRQGLRAGRFHEHWQRTHAVLADRLKAFIRDTRELRNAIADDIGVSRARQSGATAWRLGNARASAAELERAIADLNATVFDHATAVAGTPFAAVSLPHLEPWMCIKQIDTLMGRLPLEALVEADRVLNEFLEFRQPSLETLNGMFNAATGEHAQLGESCLRKRWNELLALAESHLVTDSDLEPTLVDIERRQSEGERLRLTSQIPQRPFSSER